MSSSVQNEIISKIDYTQLIPFKTVLVGDVFHKYYDGQIEAEGFQLNVTSVVNYFDNTGKLLPVANTTSENIFYYVGDKCPSNSMEVSREFLEVYQSNFCKDYTFGAVGLGLAATITTSIGVLFSGMNDKNLAAGLIFTPVLLAGIGGAVFSAICNAQYADSNEVVWQEFKTCLTEEAVINDAPIPEYSY